MRPGGSATAEELSTCCGEKLANYQSPLSVDFLAEMPRNPPGKLLKTQIRAPYWKGAGRSI